MPPHQQHTYGIRENEAAMIENLLNSAAAFGDSMCRRLSCAAQVGRIEIFEEPEEGAVRNSEIIRNRALEETDSLGRTQSSPRQRKRSTASNPRPTRRLSRMSSRRGFSSGAGRQLGAAWRCSGGLWLRPTCGMQVGRHLATRQN
jgi:hypothetical protein